jgi:hypothetical protein
MRQWGHCSRVCVTVSLSCLVRGLVRGQVTDGVEAPYPEVEGAAAEEAHAERRGLLFAEAAAAVAEDGSMCIIL